MNTTETVLLVVVLLVVIGVVAAAVFVRGRKRAQLQSTFGPEYDRTVERTGGRRDAERELAERAERRRALDIRPLPETDRLAYAERWRSTQSDFVDRPGEAVRAAGQLVTQVMAQRGYPVDDPEQMARDVSVDHAETVEQYRSAQAVSQLNDQHSASTEQLRQAMVHYKALFDDLLSDRGRPDSETRADERPPLRDDVRDEGLEAQRPETLDEAGYGTEDDRRDDGSRREPVEVVHVERSAPHGTSVETVAEGRSGATRVEQGGLLAGAQHDDVSRDRPASDRPDADRPASDRPDADRPASDRRDADRRDADRRDADRRDGDRPDVDGAARPADGPGPDRLRG